MQIRENAMSTMHKSGRSLLKSAGHVFEAVILLAAGY